MPVAFFLILIFVLAVDLLGYMGLRALFPNKGKDYGITRWIYWGADLFFILFTVAWLTGIRTSDMPDHELYRKHFYVAGVFVSIYLPKFVFAVFSLIHQLKNFLRFLLTVAVPAKKSKQGIVSTFRWSAWILYLGFFLALFVFLVTLHGIFYGRYQFEVVEKELWFRDLPASFDGLRIVHFSDTHLGSFANPGPVQEGLARINTLDPDVIIFTGDLINNNIQEVEPYIESFRALQSKEGSFSVLGNHDMGDYRRWATIEEQEQSITHLEAFYVDVGFQLLRNASHVLRRGADSLVVLGVDNWGLPPFLQYGKLEKALDGLDHGTFKLLLTHDPSHWRAEVVPQSNIQLTLSGHTHGMQMGLLNRFLRWSPSSWIYPEWAGTYRAGQQKIYVNRGFGFLSFPGRIGMPPEITLLILRHGRREADEGHLSKTAQ